MRKRNDFPDYYDGQEERTEYVGETENDVSEDAENSYSRYGEPIRERRPRRISVSNRRRSLFDDDYDEYDPEQEYSDEDDADGGEDSMKDDLDGDAHASGPDAEEYAEDDEYADGGEYADDEEYGEDEYERPRSRKSNGKRGIFSFFNRKKDDFYEDEEEYPEEDHGDDVETEYEEGLTDQASEEETEYEPEADETPDEEETYFEEEREEAAEPEENVEYDDEDGEVDEYYPEEEERDRHSIFKRRSHRSSYDDEEDAVYGEEENAEEEEDPEEYRLRMEEEEARQALKEQKIVSKLMVRQAKIKSRIAQLNYDLKVSKKELDRIEAELSRYNK